MSGPDRAERAVAFGPFRALDRIDGRFEVRLVLSAAPRDGVYACRDIARRRNVLVAALHGGPPVLRKLECIWAEDRSAIQTILEPHQVEFAFASTPLPLLVLKLRGRIRDDALAWHAAAHRDVNEVLATLKAKTKRGDAAIRPLQALLEAIAGLVEAWSGVVEESVAVLDTEAASSVPALPELYACPCCGSICNSARRRCDICGVSIHAVSLLAEPEPLRSAKADVFASLVGVLRSGPRNLVSVLYARVATLEAGNLGSLPQLPAVFLCPCCGSECRSGQSSCGSCGVAIHAQAVLVGASGYSLEPCPCCGERTATFALSCSACGVQVRLSSGPSNESQSVALQAYHRAYQAAGERRWQRAAELLGLGGSILARESTVVEFQREVSGTIAKLELLVGLMRSAHERVDEPGLQAALAELHLHAPADGRWLLDAAELQSGLQSKLRARAEARGQLCLQAQTHELARQWTEALLCWMGASQKGTEEAIELGIAGCTAKLHQIEMLSAQAEVQASKVNPEALAETVRQLEKLLPDTDERLRFLQTALLPSVQQQREALDSEIRSAGEQTRSAAKRREWDTVCRHAEDWARLSCNDHAAVEWLLSAREALASRERVYTELLAALSALDRDRATTLRRQYLQLVPADFDLAPLHAAVEGLEQAWTQLQRQLEDARRETKRGNYAVAAEILAGLTGRVLAGAAARAVAQATRSNAAAMQRAKRRRVAATVGLGSGLALLLLAIWWELGVSRVLPEAQSLLRSEQGWSIASDEELGNLLRERGLPPTWLPFRHWASAQVVKSMARASHAEAKAGAPVLESR